MNTTINTTCIGSYADFDLAQTLHSGQCFRFEERGGAFRVCAGARCYLLSQRGSSLFLHGEAAAQDIDFLTRYFDLARDYGAIKRALSAGDPVMAEACRCAGGVRVLRQDLFEALVTFILSQNNNIPRIKKIVEALCEHFGPRLEGPCGPYHAFPTPGALAGVTAQELEPLRAGFRARYVADAVEKLARGEVSLELVREAPYEQAKAELMKIRGVGEKVANCVLLFGANRLDAFPVDVWIARAIDRLYGGEIDAGRFSPHGGIAQQYLFFYAREQGLK